MVVLYVFPATDGYEGRNYVTLFWLVLVRVQNGCLVPSRNIAVILSCTEINHDRSTLLIYS